MCVCACRPVVAAVVVLSIAWAALVFFVLVGRAQQQLMLTEVVVSAQGVPHSCIQR